MLYVYHNNFKTVQTKLTITISDYHNILMYYLNKNKTNFKIVENNCL